MNAIEMRRRLPMGAGGGKIYGVAINLADTNPETAVTYTDAAVGMTPGSSAWDSTEIFAGIRPCLLKDGVVNKYLNPNNFAQDVDGNSVNISVVNDGHVMIEFPKMGYKIETEGNILTVQVTADPNMESKGFKYYAFTRQNEGDCEHLYVGAYDASMATKMIPGAPMIQLASISNQTPLTNRTIALLRSYAKAAGVGYDLLSFYPFVLLQCLYLIRYKNLDSQSALGNGRSSASDVISSGQCNTTGMYYGTANAINNSTTMPVKFAGIENLWGNVFTLIEGIRIDTNRNILTAFDNFNDNGDGYTNQGQYGTGNVTGYIAKVQGTTEKGFLPKSVAISAATFFCDRGDISTNQAVAVGGSFVNGSQSGIFNCIGVNSTDSMIGARLMYLKAGQ